MTDCKERCQRLHPHCTLTLARSIAPDNFWCWAVEMPDGHLWASKGGMTFADAVAHMLREGVYQLEQADIRWRSDHPARPNA